MLELKENFRNMRNENETCPMCSEKDTTEHLCECKSYGNDNLTLDELVGNDNKESLRKSSYLLLSRLKIRGIEI